MVSSLIVFLNAQQVLILSFCVMVLGIVMLAFWFWLYRVCCPASSARRVRVEVDRDAGGQQVTVLHREPWPGIQEAGKLTVTPLPAIETEELPCIGISTGIFYDRDIFYCLPLIKEAGFRFVEVWASPQKNGDYVHFDWHKDSQVQMLAACLRTLGLKVSSLHAPFSDALNISDPDEVRRKAAVLETLRTADVLKFLGGEFLVVHPASNDNWHPDRNSRFAQSRKSLEEIARYVRDWGLKLAVENQLPHILGGDAQTLRALVEGLPPDSVGFCFDTSHANLYPGQKLENTFKQMADRIMTLHVSDNYGERDDHFALGDGRIDWNSFAGALRSSNYNGVFMLEVSRDSLQHGQLATLDSVYRRAMQFLN